jgi:prepilin-type N-terminal cleavage/methylation domain-containing protein
MGFSNFLDVFRSEKRPLLLSRTGDFPDTHYVQRLIDNLLSKTKRDESGFTLLELLIAVVIISILTGVSIPMFSNYTRSASIATLKNDIVASVPLLVKQIDGDGVYPTQEEFLLSAPRSADNSLGLYVDGSTTEPVACIYGWHSFSETDLEYYHYSTATSELAEGDCPGRTGGTGTGTGTTGTGTTGTGTGSTGTGTTGTGTTGTGTGSTGTGTGSTGTGTGSTGTGTTGTGSSTPTPVDPMAQMGNLNFVVHYSPQGNQLNFCYSVDVSTTSPSQIAWEYKIDLSKGPFWGANPALFGSQYNYYSKSQVGQVWTVSGTPNTWNEFVSTGQPKSFGFCVTQVPEPPVDPVATTTTVTASNGNNNWYACIDLRTTSTSIYPIPWTRVVDLKNYFTSVQGKSLSFTNVTYRDLGNYVYEFSGASWNKYVSTVNPQTHSTAVCYNPAGQPW